MYQNESNAFQLPAIMEKINSDRNEQDHKVIRYVTQVHQFCKYIGRKAYRKHECWLGLKNGPLRPAEKRIQVMMNENIVQVIGFGIKVWEHCQWPDQSQGVNPPHIGMVGEK